MKTVVLPLSGGMDSVTTLAWLLSHGFRVHPVHVQYGSKHNPYELTAANMCAAHYGLELKVLDLSGPMKDFRSALLKSGDPIPEGHYEDASMSETVVPARNIIFLAFAAGLAWSLNAQHVALGIHQGDHAIYPDCRVEFYKAMDTALFLGTDRRVQIMAPFLETDKFGILKWGIPNHVPYKLTRTCYKDQLLSCGKCGACQERLEAFARHGVADPVSYAKDP